MIPDVTTTALPLAGLPRHALPDGTETAKARDAAQQFEALLLTQILRSVRESGGNWTGDGMAGGNASGDCATDFAEQQFAQVLARQGGLGLAALIEAGLKKRIDQDSVARGSDAP